MESIVLMNVERLLNSGEAPVSVGHSQEIFPRLAEVFLEQASGDPAMEMAVPERTPDESGKASPLRMVGVASVRGSECRLILESDPAHVSKVVEWLLEVTASMLPDIRQLHLRSVLYELLCNAVEHGNLEIGYQKKQQALVQGRHEELLRQRRAVSYLNVRRITIHVRYERDAERLIYRIADEGNGFAWRRFLQCSDETCGPAAVNGRGIFIARSLCPNLTYNERGNEVTMWMATSLA
ncbi:MAG: ATP-binding protein [Nitrospira sp.]|nr:ATP-binding protein [Nitrospira sp.]